MKVLVKKEAAIYFFLLLVLALSLMFNLVSCDKNSGKESGSSDLESSHPSSLYDSESIEESNGHQGSSNLNQSQFEDETSDVESQNHEGLDSTNTPSEVQQVSSLVSSTTSVSTAISSLTSSSTSTTPSSPASSDNFSSQGNTVTPNKTFYLAGSWNGYIADDENFKLTLKEGSDTLYIITLELNESNRDEMYDGHWYKITEGNWANPYGIENYIEDPAPIKYDLNGTAIGLGSIWIDENMELTVIFDSSTNTIYDNANGKTLP